MKETKKTTDELLRLINVAAKNLVLKDRKVSLGARIKRQQEENAYLRDLVTAASKKVAALAPELIEAEKNAHEAKQRYENLRIEQEELFSRLQSLRELQRRAEEIKTKAAEAERLRESLNLISRRYDGLRAQYDEASALKAEILGRLSAIQSDIDAQKAQLSKLNTEQEALLREVSGSKIMQYIHALSKDIEASLSATTAYLSSSEELTFPTELPPLIQAYGRLEGLADLIGTMVAEGIAPPDFDQQGAMATISRYKTKVTTLFADLLNHERSRLESLTSKKAEIEGEAESLRATIEKMRIDLSRVEAEINSEQSFRDQSQTMIKDLTEQIRASKAELDRLRREADEVSANIEFAEVFVEFLTPMVSQLRKVNSELNILMDDYRSIVLDMKSALGV